MILIALGANVQGPWGTPREAVSRAVAEMPRHQIEVLKVSSLLLTKPYGVVDQPDFVNAVASVRTPLAPVFLMQALHDIERDAGRKRQERWGPRTLDLDLLDYAGRIIQPTADDKDQLVLPHPGIELRRFVLEPILEIAPEWRHPISLRTAAESLSRLKAD